MEMEKDRIEIAVRMLQSGRYIWTITGNFAKETARGDIRFLHELDGELRQQFPDHVVKGSGRTGTFSDE